MATAVSDIGAVRVLRGVIAAAALAGCWTGSSPPAPEQKSAEPNVDMACVIRGEQGTLLIGLPDRVAGFTVTKAARGVHLHRDGREMPDPEASALWQSLENEWFGRGGGLAAGRHGQSSIYRCDGVGPGGCFNIEVWICRQSLEDIAASFVQVVAAHGAGDAAASIDIEYLETRGPRCQHGVDCAPVTQYSRREKYDPLRARLDMHSGSGKCRDDGDCNASQSCEAWYLDGGSETLEYRWFSVPVFCGCIAHRCTWFQQP